MSRLMLSRSDTIRCAENTAANTSSKFRAGYSTQHRLLPNRNHSGNRPIWRTKHYHNLPLLDYTSRALQYDRNDLPLLLWRVDGSNPNNSNRTTIFPTTALVRLGILGKRHLWRRSGNVRPASAGRMSPPVQMGRNMGRDDDPG